MNTKDEPLRGVFEADRDDVNGEYPLDAAGLLPGEDAPMPPYRYNWLLAAPPPPTRPAGTMGGLLTEFLRLTLLSGPLIA